MATFNPSNVDLNIARKEDVICYLSVSENEHNGHLGARISSVFVIFITSTAFTLFPVVAQRLPRWRIPHHLYLFGRYFGTGVIVATAFIHLLDPAYQGIGPQICIGMSGYCGEYSWCAEIVLASVMVIFLMDVGAEVYVEWKYNVQSKGKAAEAFIIQPACTALIVQGVLDAISAGILIYKGLVKLLARDLFVLIHVGQRDVDRSCTCSDVHSWELELWR